MFNLATFLLFVCALILACNVSYYIGKYHGVMEAYEDRPERADGVGDRADCGHHNGKPVLRGDS